MPRACVPRTIVEMHQRFSLHAKYLVLIFLVLALHLLEVNLIDPYTTALVGVNFAGTVQLMEDGMVHWFSLHWIPVLLYFTIFIYIGIYPFTLWFTPLLFLITDQKRAMKTFAYSFLLIYLITLPFYLFVPITNVYLYYGTQSGLNTVIPSVEHVFYTTTTSNNSLPSLHVAMSLLIANTVSLTDNKRYKILTYFIAGAVIFSVIYLAIHWITDVLGGILISCVVFYLVKRYTKEI
jgi:membrane-associated phospholipid phosphatase